MVNYAKGKIYKIISNHTNDIYVGSTCEDRLCKRMDCHRSHYKRYQEGKVKKGVSAFKILEHGDAQIILIENYPCNSKDELLAREQHFINLLDCVNKQKAFLTDEERIEDNRRRCKEYSKTHRDEEKVRKERYFNKHRDEYNARRRELRRLKREQQKQD